ncbi:MAG: helix-turn-helix domain-containing protein [Candidatus Pacebacteria bacterium]|nr:helix-turn-helix domain-containing protein [Candidatus Paceibacterota bacterium]
MLEKYLQDIGLNEKESILYLSLLAVDNSSVLDLSKKTGLNRSTTYVILETLAKKGLVSETTVGKKTHYQAEPPERLETYVEQRKILLEEQAKKLKDIIPQIKSVQREGGERPIVKYFQGKEGVISILEEFLEDTDTQDTEPIYLIYPKDAVDEIFSESERKKYRSSRVGKGIKSKAIYTYKNGTLSSDDTGERWKIDEKEFPISCDIAIYKDRVRINTMDKNISGIFIKSKDVADTLRSIFKLSTKSIGK